MSFIGLIERIEDGCAYIRMKDGLVEVSVPINGIKNANYKTGDMVTVSINPKSGIPSIA